MRNKFILSVLLLCVGTGLLWAQFWKGYDDAQRKSVGEAYYLAGKQYQTVGEKDKGSDYVAMARLIYPGLDPAAIRDQTLPSAAELMAQGRATAIGGGAATVPTASLSSFFLRFTGAFLDEDAAEVAGFLDGSLYLSKISQEVTRGDAIPSLQGFFDATTLSGMEPSALFDLESLVVAKSPAAMQAAWGETYTLTVKAKPDLSACSPLWDQTQQYFLRRSGGSWYIFAYGQNPPPLTFRPQKATIAVSVAPAATPEATETLAIADVFATSLSSLLQKDADGGLAAMSDTIRFLRLRQTVTRDELKITLQGYFDSADFGQATVADVVDEGSIFVQPATSPVEGVTGRVYELNVKSKLDLSAGIPYWATYQRYYFIQDGETWKVFAIL